MIDESNLDWNSLSKHGAEGVESTRPTIIFLGLARNCAFTLPTFFTFLERLNDSGVSCSAIIGENGSSDSTRMVIEKASNFGVELFDTSAMELEPDRLRRMAIGRQLLLDYLRTQTIEARLVCLADLDDAWSVPPSIPDFQSAIETLESDPALFAVGATSHPVYYDLLSLRAPGFEFLADLQSRFELAKRSPLTYHAFLRRSVYAVERRVNPLLPLHCESSFNGLCIYRAADYLLGSYRSSRETTECEHVAFNRSIVNKTGKQMLICSDLRLRAPLHHSPVGFIKFWYRQLKRRLIPHSTS